MGQRKLYIDGLYDQGSKLRVHPATGVHILAAECTILEYVQEVSIVFEDRFATGCLPCLQ